MTSRAPKYGNHWVPQTDEEEQLALELATLASLETANVVQRTQSLHRSQAPPSSFSKPSTTDATSSSSASSQRLVGGSAIRPSGDKQLPNYPFTQAYPAAPQVRPQPQRQQESAGVLLYPRDGSSRPLQSSSSTHPSSYASITTSALGQGSLASSSAPLGTHLLKARAAQPTPNLFPPSTKPAPGFGSMPASPAVASEAAARAASVRADQAQRAVQSATSLSLTRTRQGANSTRGATSSSSSSSNIYSTGSGSGSYANHPSHNHFYSSPKVAQSSSSSSSPAAPQPKAVEAAPRSLLGNQYGQPSSSKSAGSVFPPAPTAAAAAASRSSQSIATTASSLPPYGTTARPNGTPSQSQQPSYYPPVNPPGLHPGYTGTGTGSVRSQYPYSAGQQYYPSACPSSQARSSIPLAAARQPTATPATTPPAATKTKAPHLRGAASSGVSSSAQPPVPAPGVASVGDTCAGCSKQLVPNEPYIAAMGVHWHGLCFKCGFCNEPISVESSTFAVGKEDGKPYHFDCYKHKTHPTCDVCGSYIPVRAGGRIEYKENPFWREKYCPSHNEQNTPCCCACQRLQMHGQEWVQHSDGRYICFDCLDTVVHDTEEAQPLYRELLKFYADLGMPLPKEAPLALVDAHVLNEYSSKEGRDTQGLKDAPVFHVRGLTVATLYNSIPTIVRYDSAGHVRSVAKSLEHPSLVTCSVKSVLVMYGLPRLLTGCILAHELMHAWLRMRNVHGLVAKTEEGLCQLMACLWLDQQHNNLNDPKLQRLASFLAFQIREDKSDVYGGGFREAYDAFQQHGLAEVIRKVVASGK